MGSFILRLRSLGHLSLCLPKVETSHFCGNFLRNVHSNCILYSNITKQFIIHDLRASAQAAKNADFGKVVDLDCDFDQLKVDDDFSEGAQFKDNHLRRKSIKKGKQFNTEEAAEMGLEKGTNEDDIDVESESKNDIKKNFKLLDDHSNTFRFRAIGNLSALNASAFDNVHWIKNSLSSLSGTIFKTKYNSCCKEVHRNLAPEKFVTTLKSRKLRHRNRKILLEGKRLIQDALSAGHIPLKIFFSRFSDLRTLNLPENVEVIQVPYKTLNLWSDVATSQGVIGIFKMPELRATDERSNPIPLMVICDNVRDPGNLGSIIRIVAAVGGQELILTTGCVDIWDPKVLRAGAGAHFRLPIATNLSWDDIENTIPEGMQIILADNEVPVASSDFSEGNSQEQHVKSSFFRNSSELANTLPLHCYTSVRYEEEGAVVVLGGETSGLSEDAYQFAKNRKGSRVYIPMSNSTESLNNAVSLGVISYEIRRQLCISIVEETSEEINDKNDSAAEKS